MNKIQPENSSYHGGRGKIEILRHATGCNFIQTTMFCLDVVATRGAE